MDTALPVWPSAFIRHLTLLFDGGIPVPMPFSVSWHTLLDELDDLSDGAELITPLSHDRFRITNVQEHRVVVTFTETGDKRPLQRDQFETLYRRIQEANDEFDLDRLPPDADPYPAVLSLHPRFEIDEQTGTITQKDGETPTQLVSDDAETDDTERVEPDGVDVYSDALLLIDALERHEVSDLSELETNALVNLYTLCSDVQRNANEFRQNIADVLLDRLHHDQPVHSQYGSVQRTSRRNRSLKDDELVLNAFEAAGIERERLTTVDTNKVDEALDVTELSESDVYEIDESEYVRKAEVDEDVKESRLQGLKDRLAASEEEATDDLRREIEELENRIDDLTSFSTGTQMQG
ncbi:MAG: chaperonin cofactor prefoldin [Haloarculaceae archaeon]|jgi:chaperonin cofactor prefoldin